MRAISAAVLLLACSASVAQTPVEEHGRLRVEGTRLVDSSGEAVQLRGVATHGLQWHGAFYSNGAAIKSAAENWSAQVVRLTVYVYEGGYLDNPELDPADFDEQIFAIADSCVAHGVYCIIDWHVHHPGFPAYYLDDAKAFFDKVAKRYAGVPNILYEIANEPNRTGYQEIKGREVSWREIKAYADEVIPVIRKHAPESVVLVGTPAWSSLGHSDGRDWREVADSPLDHKNVLYVVHFYAAGHDFEAKVDAAAERLPLFITEWAAASWSADSQNDLNRAAAWLGVLNKHKIGWTYWNYAPGAGVFSPFQAETQPTKQNLHPESPAVTDTGKLLYRLLQGDDCLGERADDNSHLPQEENLDVSAVGDPPD